MIAPQRLVCSLPESTQPPEEPAMAETVAAPPPFDADAYVEQASRLVGIEVAAAYRAGVAVNMALIERMADLVMGLPLSVADELAPVFTPIEPGR
jgi:hypothetical protein